MLLFLPDVLLLLFWFEEDEDETNLGADASSPTPRHADDTAISTSARNSSIQATLTRGETLECNTSRILSSSPVCSVLESNWKNRGGNGAAAGVPVMTAADDDDKGTLGG